MNQTFERFQKRPQAQAGPAWERLLDRQRDHFEGVFESLDSGSDDVHLKSRTSMKRVLIPAAAVLVFGIVLSFLLWPRVAPAVVERIDGELFRVAGGVSQPLHTGERIDLGKTVQSNGNSGGTLLLADGSRVEMRAKSELLLERAEDGVSVRLNTGSILVNAAKQRKGHLYVRTRDLTVSVVGTVFLVNAEERGSHVVVFEGEVRVKQGSEESSLHPGEQVWSNLLSQTRAEPLTAALQQVPDSTARPTPAPQPLAFEAITIRPIPPVRYGTCQTQANQVRINPDRMVLRGVNTYWLILAGYQEGSGLLCDYPETWRFLADKPRPDWFESIHFDVEATIPPGTVTYTGSMVRASENLKMMIRSMMENRFKLKMHQITQVVDGYVMRVDKSKEPSFKMTPWNPDTDPVTEVARSGYRIVQDPKTGQTVYETVNIRWSMADLLHTTVDDVEKPVIDETGITGYFNFTSRSSCPSLGLLFMQTGQAVRTTPCENTLASPGETYQRLGFKLEPAKVTVKTWVIDHIEKPSEN